ncbi:peptidase S8/S53 domain-containing protein [Mycena epipterygia]|nr:peptidase S8/S53 domain-containing protein [Mycena epipterygia]
MRALNFLTVTLVGVAQATPLNHVRDLIILRLTTNRPLRIQIIKWMLQLPSAMNAQFQEPFNTLIPFSMIFEAQTGNASEFMTQPGVQVDASWALARLSQSEKLRNMAGPMVKSGLDAQYHLPEVPSQVLTNKWNYPTDTEAGKGVFVGLHAPLWENNSHRQCQIYILDSGVYADHLEFGGRVEEGYAVDDIEGGSTAVASIATGTRSGVAKAATIIPIKLSRGKDSKPTDEAIEQGINRAVRDFIERKEKSSEATGIINLSVTVDRVDEIGAEIRQCPDRPEYYGQIYVGSVDWNDNRQNAHGQCIDIFAPGVLVLGTSFSAPLVSGMIAVEGMNQYTSIEPGSLSLKLMYSLEECRNKSPADMKAIILRDYAKSNAGITNRGDSKNYVLLQNLRDWMVLSPQ